MNPATIPGMQFFATGNDAIASGSNVTRWTDKTALHNDAIPLAGFAPTLNLTGFNGQKALVTIGASNQVISTPALAIAGGVITVFYVGFWTGGTVLWESTLDPALPGFSGFDFNNSGNQNLEAISSNLGDGASFDTDTTTGFNFAIPTVLVATYTLNTGSTPRVSIIANGVTLPVASTGAQPAKLFVNAAVNIGARVSGGASSFGSSQVIAAYGVAAGDRSALAPQFRAYAALTWGLAKYQLDADGDSITFGFNVGGNPGSYVAQAGVIAGRTNATDNLAVSGDVSSGVIGRLPTAVLDGNGLYPNVYTVAIGTNDLAGFPGTDLPGNLANLKANLITICDTMRRAGWRVVVCTLLPRSAIFQNGATQVQFNADRANYNAFVFATLLAGGHCDAVADFASSPIYGADAAALDVSKFPDGVHPVESIHVDMGQTFYVPAISRYVTNFP